MIDFRILTFLKVCECMNFTQAAKELNLSQPAVSQHIKYLENRYECTLFLRNKKNIYLTEQGKLLLGIFKTMEIDDKKIKDVIKNSERKIKKISFGVTKTVGEFTVKNAIKSFIKDNNDTNFSIYYKNTKTILEYLVQGAIDFAIIEGFVKQDDFSVIKIKAEDYIAVSSYNHLFPKSSCKISDLLNERIIVRESGSGTLAILENMLSIQNLSISDFSNVIQTNSMQIIIELLKNDCGISFLHKSAVENHIKNKILKEIKLDDFKLTHDLCFIWNKNSIFSEKYKEIALNYFM